MHRLAPLAALALFALGCAAAPPPPASPAAEPSGGACPAGTKDPLCSMTEEQLARKLLEATGAANLGKQVGDSLLDTFRKMKGLPPGFVDKLKANIRHEELTEIVVPIYTKHYKRETMIAAIRFYQSTEGRAMVEALPEATKESMAAGQAWGKHIAEKTLKDMGMAATAEN